GLEVAASLLTRGLEVHVVAPEARPMEPIFGPEAADLVRQVHEEHGVAFHLGTTAASFDPNRVTLKSGEQLASETRRGRRTIRSNVTSRRASRRHDGRPRAPALNAAATVSLPIHLPPGESQMRTSLRECEKSH